MSRFLLLCSLSLLSAGVAFSQDQAAGGAKGGKKNAQVEMLDAQGKSLGTLKLAAKGGDVRVTGTLKGLTPGPHGFHIHQVGKCEAPGFTTAGGHYNPDGKKHGDQNPEGPHAGDLGNLTVGQNGSVKVNAVAKGVDLSALANTSLMIHAKEDDRKTDPSGNSGDRIACGVIPQ